VKKLCDYRIGLLFDGIFFIAGIILNSVLPAPILFWPWDMIFGVTLLLTILISKILFSKTKVVQWLSSFPAAISSILLFLIVIFLMGVVPQNDNNLNMRYFPGLSCIKNSWLYLLSLVYLLTVLEMAVIKRLLPFTIRNFAFVLQHTGLWIIAFSISFASNDLIRLQIPVNVGELTESAINSQGHEEKLPFKIQLSDFQIEEYPAKIAVISIDNPENPLESNKLDLIGIGRPFQIGHFNIRVFSYLPSATKLNDTCYISSNDSLSCQAALLEVKDVITGEILKGWVSSGSPLFKASTIRMGDSYISMTIPQPKEFRSLVTISLDNRKETHIIQVNHPASIGKWKIYQMGYDENMGKFSRLSILEAIKDPWLPVVYSGFLLLIFGILHFFWEGNRSNLKTHTNDVD
jgi:hypothetical protein